MSTYIGIIDWTDGERAVMGHGNLVYLRLVAAQKIGAQLPAPLRLVWNPKVEEVAEWLMPWTRNQAGHARYTEYVIDDDGMTAEPHEVRMPEPSSVQRLIALLAERGIVARFEPTGGSTYAVWVDRSPHGAVVVFDSGLDDNTLHREHEYTDAGRVQWAVQVEDEEEDEEGRNQRVVRDGIPLEDVELVAALVAWEVTR
jgi:hypothetical protein